MMHEILPALSIRFERLVDEVREGITVSDPNQPDNPLVYVNPGFEKLTGYRSADVLGRNCRFLQGPGTDPQAVEHIRHVLRQREEAVVELLNYRRDGSSFWNSVSLSPVFSEAGDLIYYIGVQMDVSERRMREEKEREFVDNLSHELKTPLAAQIGIVETLQRHRGLSEDKRMQLYDRLRSQCIRLHQTVEDILSLASLDSAIQSSSRRLIDMRAAIMPALESAEALALLSSVSFSYELPAEPLCVNADENEMGMLVTNLLSNAINYNRSGGSAKLELHAEAGHALLRVSDSGIGIPPEHQQRIFERFYRVDRARSRASGGTGLGLAIVREIVLAHGGGITLESSPGKGSVFSVKLPLARLG